ncbi:MAG: RluA family pseudouridine synthase [Clostridiales bacterium]|nr:RluA family pseudouridine synthase [Clostridiales bacterium]
MKEIIIGENEKDQRLDRFLKKYLKNAPLSHIFKIIRKDVKVNGKRKKIDDMLKKGDVITLYISDYEIEQLTYVRDRVRVKKQFKIVYEDDNIIVVDKPLGLLIHGDKNEKKNHLTNQVIDYLIEKGAYEPRTEKTFVPAPVNRLDRNTTGLVLFAKNAMAVKKLNEMMRNRDNIEKYYLTIVKGNIDKEMFLSSKMTKDEEKNMITVHNQNYKEGKLMETVVRPIKKLRGYTLVEVNIITGRTHQIRAHLSSIGHPVIGDVKYGERSVNFKFRKDFELNTQLLHSYKLVFKKCLEGLKYLEGKELSAEIPDTFQQIMDDIDGR